MDRTLLNFLASPREREISLGEVKGVLRLLPAAKLLSRLALKMKSWVGAPLT